MQSHKQRWIHKINELDEKDNVNGLSPQGNKQRENIMAELQLMNHNIEAINEQKARVQW